MAALLTPEFHASNWTDQEVGIAIGRGVLVVPVRLPETPYGFIAKQQALPGDLTDTAGLASALVDILLKRRPTAAAMREGLVLALESSPTFAASRLLTAKIESTRGFTEHQFIRIEACIASNRQVGDSIGVPERLRRVIGRGSPAKDD
jgi:hypothetical protein